jgi:hypothetical protein
MSTDWSPTPPRFVRRWAAQGVRPDGNPTTTIFDLLPGRAHIAVYPATLDTFAVRIDVAAMEVIVSTVELRTACEVPAWHAVHGKRRLGLRPYDLPLAHRWIDRPAEAPLHDGPVELYVDLPNGQMNIIYGWKRLAAFRAILREILDPTG